MGLAIAVAAICSASALAVTPKAGCWGTCGGDAGPVHGYFFVTGGKIQNGLSAEFKCLGTQKIAQPVGPPLVTGDTLELPRPANSHSLPSSLKISEGGHFSFDGYGERFGNHVQSKVKVNLSGEFVSRTKALLTFHIAYGRCGTQHLTVLHVT